MVPSNPTLFDQSKRVQSLQTDVKMGQPSFQASNAIIYMTYAAFL
jgi:hypothetical protein